MDFGFFFTIGVLLLMTVALMKEWFSTDIVVFGSLLCLIMGGVIDVEEGFSGFSNPGMLTVGFLFIVAYSMQKTGAFKHVGRILLGKKGGINVKLFRLLFPISFLSAFFNNTPIVAMLVPVLKKWAKKNDFAVSKFLIPLSYAAILGGTCTLIGTSTNLVVHGLMIENGMNGFSFFELSKVGIPVAVVGLLFIIFAGPFMLPERLESMAELGEQAREFVVAVKIGGKYPHIGKTLVGAGLRHLKGLFLFQIEREGHLLSPVGPEERLQLNDRLFFTGLPETIIELQKTPGLYVVRDPEIDLSCYDSDDFCPYEVVISHDSHLVGKTVRDSRFRSHYNAVIIAIHRAGERICKKIGDIIFRPGDTLLIFAKHSFFDRWYHSRDFYLVSKAESEPSKPLRYTWLSVTVLVLMIIGLALNAVPILLSVGLAAVVLVLSRCITSREAQASVEWHILLIIASAFGISRAMVNSGVAEFLARHFITWFGACGPLGLLFSVYFMTGLYTNIITNNAAAALVFPIALSLARQSGLDLQPFCIAVALAASASFATPIGYQTNLMVYGPGGYRFADFMRIGIPMNIVTGAVVIICIYVWYF